MALNKARVSAVNSIKRSYLFNLKQESPHVWLHVSFCSVAETSRSILHMAVYRPIIAGMGDSTIIATVTYLTTFLLYGFLRLFFYLSEPFCHISDKTRRFRDLNMKQSVCAWLIVILTKAAQKV